MLPDRIRHAYWEIHSVSASSWVTVLYNANSKGYLRWKSGLPICHLIGWHWNAQQTSVLYFLRRKTFSQLNIFVVPSSEACVPAGPGSLPAATSKTLSAAHPEVHRRRRQIVGGLPPEGDTALLPSHFGGVHLCLFWFSISRTPLPPSDDNVT